MEARVRMYGDRDRRDSERGYDDRRDDDARDRDGRCGRGCGRRRCSPLAGLYLIGTVASLTVIASLLYWQPSMLSAGLAGVSKGPLAASAEWVQAGAGWAHAHAKHYWEGFLGAIFGLWFLYRVMMRACCRRAFFFLTALLTVPITAVVMHQQWPALMELFATAPKP